MSARPTSARRKKSARSAKKAGAKKSKRGTPKRSPLERLRKIVGDWPETDERISHGAPTWWGGRKTFATFHDNHHGDGRVAVWVKSDFETQSSLVEADPGRFFVPPYVGPSGWLGIELSGRVDWNLVESLLMTGYRSVAPKRAIMQLETGGDD